ncbi:MAG: hypothetical protein ABW321_31555 [Polyangiales bacterium]
MNQLSRRTLTLWVALVVAACGSDDDTDTRPDDQEQNPDSGSDRPSDRRDAGSPDDVKDAGKDAATADARPAADGCDPSCESPAVCEEQGGEARCVCPEGYEDDDGKCVDINECDGENECGRNSVCKNKPGGYDCTCREPAYQGDGKSCSCADGFEEVDGECLAPNGNKCGDNLDCASAHCIGGTCCANECEMPDRECLTTEGATCADGETCKLAVAKDGAKCDDGNACTEGSVCQDGECQVGETPKSCDDGNPCTDDSCDTTIGCKTANNTAACDDGNACTSADSCSNGSCRSTTLVDCSASADACNTGVCDTKDGSCKKQPANDGKACDDTSACTTLDKCNEGACTGGSACGPNAESCAPGADATTYTCTCAATFVESNGRCVPENDECAASPCGENADCLDASNAADDFTCTCLPGFEGDGQTCVQVDPCATDPCGAGLGTCNPGASGSGEYTCTCNAGLTEVDGKCVCNMGGTFAVRTELTVSWEESTPIQAGTGTTYSWTIERHNYTPDGALDIEVIPCGETNIDVCSERFATLAAEAYAQYVPINVWGKPGAPSTQLSTTLLDASPNQPFVVPEHAILQGISLADPLGEWPSRRQDVEGADGFDGSATNGARWVDSDNDEVFGLTTYTVGPQGVAADGSDTAPIEGYSGRSETCNLPYNYPPAAEANLVIRRVKRFFSANRVINSLEGTINSCDEVTGNVTGPANGAMKFDTRIGGCLRANGDGEAACSDDVLEFLDTTAAPNEVNSSTFIMKRVADDVTCAAVRDLGF